MAIRSGFFQSVNGDRKYKADFFASYFSSFVGNGVFPNPSTNLQVLSSTNLDVIVRPGKGWINGYYLINDSDLTITVGTADGVLGRIDRIVFALDFDTREMSIYLKPGTPGSNPVAPPLIRNATTYELALADINVVAGTTSINQGLITDQRLNSNLCGVVTGLINQVDTSTLFLQYQTQFQNFLQDLEDALSGDVAGNLFNLINDLDERVTSLENKTEYQVATVNSNVIMVNKYGNTNRILFRLTNTVNGNLRISTDGGTTSLPLVDVDNVQITSVEKGFAEVVQVGNFFFLRNKGLSQVQMLALIAAANEVEANSNVLKGRFVTSVNSARPGINLNNNSSWNDILIQIPNISSGLLNAQSGTTNSSSSSRAFINDSSGGTVNMNYLEVTGLPFKPSYVIINNTVYNTIYSESFQDGIDTPGVSRILTNNANTTQYIRPNQAVTIENGSFLLPVFGSNVAYSWVAIG